MSRFSRWCNTPKGSYCAGLFLGTATTLTVIHIYKTINDELEAARASGRAEGRNEGWNQGWEACKTSYDADIKFYKGLAAKYKDQLDGKSEQNT